MAKILIVDDDPGIRETYSMVLEGNNHSVHAVSSGIEALEEIKNTPIDIVLLDLKLPDINGFEILKKIKELNPSCNIIIISGFTSMDTVIKAMKEGAYDFLPKPLDPECIKIDIDKAVSVSGLISEVASLKSELIAKTGAENLIVGNTKKIQEIFKIIGKASGEKITVLIEGESGTGKELTARAIHKNSLRKNHPFVPVDCTAMPKTLIESELFGHEKGSFTGAVQRRLGKFEQADKGTIFLDEISTMDLRMQAKFLRVIQEQEFQRIGGEKPVKVDVRIIAATNKNLEEMVKSGTFREDLYHRLNVVRITLPPLRDRREDIPLLVNHFLKKFMIQHDGKFKRISKDALNALIEYNWPGNIRELENIIYQAIITGKGNIITPGDINLPKHPLPVKTTGEYEPDIPENFSLQDKIRKVETAYIKSVLKKTNSNYTHAAKLLGIDRKVLTYKIKKYGISAD